jgi:hypothetical protein
MPGPRSLAALGESQKSESASDQARGGVGLGPMIVGEFLKKGASIRLDLLAQKVLGELARDAETDRANSHSYKKAA